jgi:hypothetical protein
MKDNFIIRFMNNAAIEFPGCRVMLLRMAEIVRKKKKSVSLQSCFLRQEVGRMWRNW